MRIDIDFKGILFDDFPSKLALQDYENQLQKVVKHFGSHPAVSAIYTMGRINHPGISDLDVVLVLKSHQKLIRRENRFFANLDKRVFLHKPFIISEDIFPYLPFIFYSSNLEKLRGREYEFIEPLSEVERPLAWLICAEAAIARLRDIVGQTAADHSISLRKMLLKLYSIRHNIYLFMKLNNDAELRMHSQFSDQITELREACFSLTTEEQIHRTRAVLLDGITILLDIIDRLSKLRDDILKISTNGEIQKNHIILPNSLQIIRFHTNCDNRIESIHNPLSLLLRFSGDVKTRLSRHLAEISVISLPKEVAILFDHETNGFSKNGRKLIDYFTKGSKQPIFSSPADWKTLIKGRSYLIQRYNEFMAMQEIRSASFLLMGSWNIIRKTKFYKTKKIILERLAGKRLSGLGGSMLIELPRCS